MPEMRDYIVKQTRSVEVRANTLVDAIRIADAAFLHGQNRDARLRDKEGLEGIWGDTTAPIKELKLEGDRIR